MVRAFLEDDLDVWLDWVQVPEAFRMILTDPGQDLDVTIPYGKDAYIEAVCSYVPEARKQVTRYVELWTDVGKALQYLVQARGNPDRKVLTKEHASFLKTCPYTVDQVARAVRLPKRARDIMRRMQDMIVASDSEYAASRISDHLMGALSALERDASRVAAAELTEADDKAFNLLRVLEGIE